MLNREIHLPEIAGDYCIGGGGVGGGGFIITLPTRCSPDLVAINPFTGDRLPLPPTSTLPQLIRPDSHQRLLPTGVTLIDGQGATFQATMPGSLEQVRFDVKYMSLFNGFVTLSPSLDMAILTRSTDWGGDDAYFASLTPATSSTWTPLPLPNIDNLCDCIFHKDRLIFVNKQGSIATFVGSGDPLKPRPMLRHRIGLMDDNDVRKVLHRAYLVESPDGEDLFLVWRRCESRPLYLPMITVEILVFRLDTNDNYEWKEVNTIGDLAFFVGSGRSISLHALDHPERIKPDSIYYTDDPPTDYFYTDLALGDNGVFDLQCRTIQHFQLTDGENELKWPPPVWVVPATC